jgi:hypothetical protein
MKMSILLIPGRTGKHKLICSILGYFMVKGCDGVNPTLGMEINVTHIFLQKSHYDYYHPLGFAYYPDGDHAGMDELCPSFPPPFSGSTCEREHSCPTPMYFLNDEILAHGLRSKLHAAMIQMIYLHLSMRMRFGKLMIYSLNKNLRLAKKIS